MYITYNTVLKLRMVSCGLVKTILNFYRQGKESAFQRQRSRPKVLELLADAQAAQAYSLYFIWNFGSELFMRLCMGIYQICQNGRICAEMLK